MKVRSFNKFFFFCYDSIYTLELLSQEKEFTVNTGPLDLNVLSFIQWGAMLDLHKYFFMHTPPPPVLCRQSLTEVC